MSESIAVTRARIACQIYLALYDAGHDGLIFAAGADYLPGVPIPDEPDVVREVIQRLWETGVIRELDSGHPGIAVLHPDVRFRMEQPIWPPLTIAEHLRRDLTAHGCGDANVTGDFLGLESMVRTGHTHTRGL